MLLVCLRFAASHVSPQDTASRKRVLPSVDEGEEDSGLAVGLPLFMVDCFFVTLCDGLGSARRGMFGCELVLLFAVNDWPQPVWCMNGLIVDCCFVSHYECGLCVGSYVSVCGVALFCLRFADIEWPPVSHHNSSIREASAA